MLPLEPLSGRCPPSRTCSAQQRERRALATSLPRRRAQSSDDSIMPFEPLRRPPPKRSNSASERSRRALAVTTRAANVVVGGDDAPPVVPVCHALFVGGKYEQALVYYQGILLEQQQQQQPNAAQLSVAEYVEVVCNAAKCCYHLHKYVEEHAYCQLALDRMALVDDDSSASLGKAKIQCTLLKAKALGRQRKTVESLQVLRDCRGLIHKYTCYKTVKEYMSQHHVDHVGFVGGHLHTKVAMIVPGV